MLAAIKSTRWMQAQARFSGLPEGRCRTCQARPEHFWLHKFRATFATWSLWANVDLRTVQSWLGHSDLESTMRYLKPSRVQQVREKVNEIFV
jgi:integrase